MKKAIFIFLFILLASAVFAQEWRSINSIPLWAETSLRRALMYGFTAINMREDLKRKDVKKEVVELLDNLYKYSDTAIVWANHTNKSVIIVWTDDCKIYSTAILWRY